MKKRRWVVKLSFLILAVIQMSCSIDSSITDLNPIKITDEMLKQSVQTDFISAEVITTNTGVVFTGSIGEISIPKKLSSGVEFEGIIYE